MLVNSAADLPPNHVPAFPGSPRADAYLAAQAKDKPSGGSSEDSPNAPLTRQETMIALDMGQIIYQKNASLAALTTLLTESVVAELAKRGTPPAKDTSLRVMLSQLEG